MCQLLGMNCAAPTDFSFSMKGFCIRGGETDIHSHGWGMCVYEGKGAIRAFHDTLPACKSPIAQLVQNYPMQSYVSVLLYCSELSVAVHSIF
jgi:predicted glutamine amidotransferase